MPSSAKVPFNDAAETAHWGDTRMNRFRVLWSVREMMTPGSARNNMSASYACCGERSPSTTACTWCDAAGSCAQALPTRQIVAKTAIHTPLCKIP